MHKVYLIIFLALSGGHVFAQAEEQTPAQAQEQAEIDPQMAAALEDYGKVAAGWHLNQRCWFLTGEKRGRFTIDVELLNIVMARDLGQTKVLELIQRRAMQAANQPPFNACGKDAEDVVSATSQHAASWSNEIRKLITAAREQQEQKQQEAQPE